MQVLVIYPPGLEYPSSNTLRFIINGGIKLSRGVFKDFEKLLSRVAKI